MTIQPAQLSDDHLKLIPQFADRQTLAILRLVSKLFANDEELHKRLFCLEHPNLDLTRIQPASWKELRNQRTLAERNFCKEIFREKPIYTLPPQSVYLKTRVFKERQFITYFQKLPQLALFLHDVQKDQTLSFPILGASFGDLLDFFEAMLDEVDGEIYVSLYTFKRAPTQYIHALLKVEGEALTEVQRYTTNTRLSVYKWISCKESNTFRFAMTTENQLQISTSPTSCRTKNFNEKVRLIGDFFWEKRSLLAVHFPDRNNDVNVAVCDFNTLEERFYLEVPQEQERNVSNWCRTLLKDHQLTFFCNRNKIVYVFEIPSFPETAVTYKHSSTFESRTNLLHIYFKAKMHEIISWVSSCNGKYETNYAYSDRTSLKGGVVSFRFSTQKHLTLCESQGLPILLAHDETRVSVLNFNFMPTIEKKQTKTVSKVDPPTRRSWKEILLAVAGVGLLVLLFGKMLNSRKDS